MTSAARTTPPHLTLYDAADDLLDVERFIDEHSDALIAAGGDLDALPELAQLLDATEGRFHERVEALALRIFERELLYRGRKEQSARFVKLAKADEATIAYLRAYLVREQRRANRTKVEAPRARALVVKNSSQHVERIESALPLWAIVAHALCVVGDDATAVETSDGALSAAYAWNVLATEIRAAYDATPFAGDAARAFADDVLRSITRVEPDVPRATYMLNRERVLDVWEDAYREATSVLRTLTAIPLSEYEIDVQAQQIANAAPLLVALGVRVEQGYHVRLK